MTDPPDLKTFLAADQATVAAIAPRTVIYMPGGTRRAAALAGIRPESDDYVQWSRRQLIQAVEQLFQHGIQHVFTAAIVPTNWAENRAHQEMLATYAHSVIAGESAMADYRQLGWRVRLLGGAELPSLVDTNHFLRDRTTQDTHHTLWWMVMLDEDAPFRWMFDAVLRSQRQTREAVIQELYGESVPLANLYIASGKPAITPALVPPLLIGDLQCYWIQRPGYYLPPHLLRRILYDAAYTRKTWRKDKQGRAETAIMHRDTWMQDVVIGLGRRLGEHWYPASHEENE
ncbi:MAG TPA: hypothetical protein VFZ66_27700 [Herpetosiphonaceae bacterium]